MVGRIYASTRRGAIIVHLSISGRTDKIWLARILLYLLGELKLNRQRRASCQVEKRAEVSLFILGLTTDRSIIVTFTRRSVDPRLCLIKRQFTADRFSTGIWFEWRQSLCSVCRSLHKLYNYTYACLAYYTYNVLAGSRFTFRDIETSL